ncbi:ABC transporter permease [Neoroseomonas oryzicola]|uniref:ABC transporter permease n=1 Tax=Neoroseomonas oryzicola TaxID=535904 RepID=A0A9X9WPF0_9PROT|nr:FtsX-like permease family protein [Neoroseomonas oryzicola]MBR0662210.1 ABC transporter permease [Neoroseomonas oryzicola]NKE20231.1 ABC transporter permease [Neoroseomonas oryzicola]
MRSWLPFEWIAAIRFLRDGWMQTIFILAGVSMGVAVIVFMSALLTGLQANFLSRVLSAQAHLVLLPPDEVARPLRAAEGLVQDAVVQRPSQRIRSIDQWQTLLRQMQAMPQVAEATPVASGGALAMRGEASRSITLTGVEPEGYFRIVRLPDSIVAGQPRLTSEDIVIGTDLASEIGVGVGDKLRVTTATGRDATLTVTGLFDLGNRGVNERSTFVALRTAQSLLGLTGGVTSLQITVRDPYAAETVAQLAQGMTGIRADSWIRTNLQFFTAVNAQQTSNTVIRLSVGLSVALGIASVLVVSVVQRSREIGILRAMGARRGQILRVFLIQGGVLGLLGALIGSAAGAGALVAWHASVRQADGSQLFPLIIQPQLFVIAAVLAAVTGVLAAMAPALRAARLDPVVAIRG